MAGRKSRGNTTLYYNSNNITSYVDGHDLDDAIDQMETTNLASTGVETVSGDATWTLKMSGMWDNAIDAILGPDAVTPGTKRTAYVTYTGTSATVTYTWTTNAEISNYKISPKVGDFIKFTCDLALSGAPTRTSV
jgi:trans-2-enoyl-CoA reductase